MPGTSYSTKNDFDGVRALDSSVHWHDASCSLLCATRSGESSEIITERVSGSIRIG